MKTYIFTQVNTSPKRGYNRTVKVWRIKNNRPAFVGYDDEINTASYRGDRAIANQIISDNDGHKMRNPYDLLSDKIKVIEI